MQNDYQTIEDYKSLGMKRLQELIDIKSCSPEEYLPRLDKLSWVRVKEVIDNPIRTRFSLAFILFLDLLKIVIDERGPGVLGYIKQLEFSLSLRVNASYQPHSRIIRLNLGFMSYINELEATYRWFDSLFFTGAGTMSLDEIERLAAPPDVEDEITALLEIGNKGMPINEKFGLGYPMGVMFLQFIMAHELAHLIDSAESPKLQTSWRQSAWSDYDDALDYSRSVGWIGQTHYSKLHRSSLDDHVIKQWGSELVADGLAFYTVSKIPPSNYYILRNGEIPSSMTRAVEPRLAYPMLQIAVEIFFFSLITAYRGKDIGTDSHPPPTLRCFAIRASQRKLYGLSWSEFLADYWGCGMIANQLLTRALRKVRRKK